MEGEEESPAVVFPAVVANDNSKKSMLTEAQQESLAGYLEQREKFMTAPTYKLTLKNKCD